MINQQEKVDIIKQAARIGLTVLRVVETKPGLVVVEFMDRSRKRRALALGDLQKQFQAVP